ncbi:hypothetical protein B4Q13_20085, partial [Lacticaseibacillus rhamnosus]
QAVLQLKMLFRAHMPTRVKRLGYMKPPFGVSAVKTIGTSIYPNLLGWSKYLMVLFAVRQSDCRLTFLGGLVTRFTLGERWSEAISSSVLRPMILCGQFSLQIFCLGVFLAFAGSFVLTESSAGLGLHALVGILGILIMCAAAEALSTTGAGDAADLALQAFRTLRPGQPQWLELGERAVAVLSRTQRAADTIAVADVLLATVDDVEVVARI